MGLRPTQGSKFGSTSSKLHDIGTVSYPKNYFSHPHYWGILWLVCLWTSLPHDGHKYKLRKTLSVFPKFFSSPFC